MGKRINDQIKNQNRYYNDYQCLSAEIVNEWMKEMCDSDVIGAEIESVISNNECNLGYELSICVSDLKILFLIQLPVLKQKSICLKWTVREIKKCWNVEENHICGYM